jgi:hypothetical protein
MAANVDGSAQIIGKGMAQVYRDRLVQKFDPMSEYMKARDALLDSCTDSEPAAVFTREVLRAIHDRADDALRLSVVTDMIQYIDGPAKLDLFARVFADVDFTPFKGRPDLLVVVAPPEVGTDGLFEVTVRLDQEGPRALDRITLREATVRFDNWGNLVNFEERPPSPPTPGPADEESFERK